MCTGCPHLLNATAQDVAIEILRLLRPAQTYARWADMAAYTFGSN
jgi:hypothetical protein